MKRPLQVYLDQEDRSLLQRLARRLGLSMAETIRTAIRRLAADLAGERDPLLELAGSIDDPNVPSDLSTRHDEYFVFGFPSARVAEKPTDSPGSRD